ncbi:hypothetical protein BC941DRAFT_469165 [Chlamydoabsidia padenii]|nr:hypothetical protein BC941DRAFT_469165 [Chlamydoabsidia padenii]
MPSVRGEEQRCNFSLYDETSGPTRKADVLFLQRFGNHDGTLYHGAIIEATIKKRNYALPYLKMLVCEEDPMLATIEYHWGHTGQILKIRLQRQNLEAANQSITPSKRTSDRIKRQLAKKQKRATLQKACDNIKDEISIKNGEMERLMQNMVNLWDNSANINNDSTSKQDEGDSVND